MRKTCCRCKKSRDVKFFKSNAKKKDGLQGQCIDCQKEYRREHYLKNRQKYIDKAAVWRTEFREWWREYKKQFSCSKCGEDHPACIQFHHHNDDKEFNIAELVGASKEKLLKEIDKCTVLCANCHFKLHYERH